MICDLGIAFTSELMSELATLLEIQLKHSTLKQVNNRTTRKESCVFETNTTNKRKPEVNRLASLPRHSNFFTQHNVCPGARMHTF